jgi:DnaD/phage-associated family protein
MTAKYWIKLYHEILDDPKMGTLPDWLWRRAIELFLLAGENDKGGLLQPVSYLAWRLRIGEGDMGKSLRALNQIGVAHETAEGWVITHFAERQAAVPDDERQRRKRERDRKAEDEPQKEEETRHAAVTKRDIDTDTDINTTTTTTGAPTFRDVHVFYERNIGTLVPTIFDELKAWYADPAVPNQWLIDAIRKAAQRGVFNWAYARAILTEWKAQGTQATRQPRAAGKTYGKRTPSAPKPTQPKLSDAEQAAIRARAEKELAEYIQ